MTHIRNHPYPEEKYNDLDALLVRLDLHGYGPEIINLDGEMVSAMIERKVKSKIYDLRKQLMQGYVPPQSSWDHLRSRAPALPPQHQQQPTLAKEEDQDGDDGLIDLEQLDHLMATTLAEERA